MASILESSITTMNTAIEALDYFDKQFVLCELVRNGDKIYPAQYSTEGEYKEINFDEFDGVSYWRKTGPVDMTEGDKTIACKDVIRFTYNLRFVGAIKKEKLTSDDAYSEERIIQTILSVLVGSNKTIKTAIGANMVFINPSSHDDDSLRILQTEYSELDNINYSYAYFRIDLDLVIDIREDCIPKECE